MLGRLDLVIHWGMYVWVLILLVQELYENGLLRLVSAETTRFRIPFIYSPLSIGS